ncbi:MAG TPA: DUF1844 domain-containing protein [Polyangia bacterium]|nr:DUF1844 domain-containing protein [Polyangia bacterium]
MSSSEEKPSGFTVTDRRSFSSSGEPVDSTAPPASAPAEAPPPAAEAPKERVLPPVDFGTFVLSLASSAIMHLGGLEEAAGSKPKKDLPLAKHSIDILSMLQAKTKGNLSPQEDRLLESLLYDLRLQYVAASKG